MDNSRIDARLIYKFTLEKNIMQSLSGKIRQSRKNPSRTPEKSSRLPRGPRTTGWEVLVYSLVNYIHANYIPANQKSFQFRRLDLQAYPLIFQRIMNKVDINI